MPKINIADLVATMSVDDKSFIKSVDNARNSLTSLDKQAQTSATNVGNSFSQMSSTLSKVAGAMAALWASLKGIDFANSLVNSAEEADRAMRKVQATLDSIGGSFAQMLPEIEAFASAMVDLGFDDEEVATSVANLLAVTRDYATSLTLAQAAMDLAAFKGISLSDATTAVTRAYMGNTRELKALGIETAKGAKGMDALRGMMERLEGQAEANISPAQVLKTHLQNLGEAIGKIMQPFRDGLIRVLTDFTKWLENLPGRSKSAIAVLVGAGSIAAALSAVAVAANAVKTALSGLGVASFLTGVGAKTAEVTATSAALNAMKAQITSLEGTAETGKMALAKFGEVVDGLDDVDFTSAVNREAESLLTLVKQGEIAEERISILKGRMGELEAVAPKAAKGMGGIGGAIKGIGTAVKGFFLSPVGIAIAALAVLALGVKKAWDTNAGFREDVKKLGQALKPVGEFFVGLGRVIIQGFSEAISFVADLIALCVKNIRSWVELIGAIFKGDWKKVWSLFVDIIDTPIKMVVSAVRGVGRIIDKVLGGLFSLFGEGARKLYYSIRDWLVDGIQKVFNTLVAWFNKVRKFLGMKPIEFKVESTRPPDPKTKSHYVPPTPPSNNNKDDNKNSGVSEWTLAKALADADKSFTDIDKKAAIFGDTMDVNAEKASLLQGLISDIIEHGINPNKLSTKHIGNLVGAWQKYNSLAKKTKDETYDLAKAMAELDATVAEAQLQYDLFGDKSSPLAQASSELELQQSIMSATRDKMLELIKNNKESTTEYESLNKQYNDAAERAATLNARVTTLTTTQDLLNQSLAEQTAWNNRNMDSVDLLIAQLEAQLLIDKENTAAINEQIAALKKLKQQQKDAADAEQEKAEHEKNATDAATLLAQAQETLAEKTGTARSANQKFIDSLYDAALKDGVLPEVRDQLLDIAYALQVIEDQANNNPLAGIEKGIDDMNEDMGNWSKHQTDMVRQTATSMADLFTNLFMMPFKEDVKDLGDYLQDFARTLIQMFIRSMAEMLTSYLMTQAAMLLGKVFGGGTSSIAGGSSPAIFTPRALGGPVLSGRSYLVGERGPELLTMGASGRITPNSQLSPNFTVNIQNNTSGRSEVKTTQPQFDGRKWVLGVIVDAASRNEGGFRDMLGAVMA